MARFGVALSRKYPRADIVEPRFKLTDRPSKPDPFAEQLAAWRPQDAGKSRKQKRTTSNCTPTLSYRVIAGERTKLHVVPPRCMLQHKSSVRWPTSQNIVDANDGSDAGPGLWRRQNEHR